MWFENSIGRFRLELPIEENWKPCYKHLKAEGIKWTPWQWRIKIIKQSQHLDTSVVQITDVKSEQVYHYHTIFLLWTYIFCSLSFLMWGPSPSSVQTQQLENRSEQKTSPTKSLAPIIRRVTKTLNTTKAWRWYFKNELFRKKCLLFLLSAARLEQSFPLKNITRKMQWFYNVI